MARTIDDQLLEAFSGLFSDDASSPSNGLAGGGAAEDLSPVDAVQSNSASDAEISSFDPSDENGIGQNYHGTSGSSKSSSATSGNGGGIGSTIESFAKTAVGSGFGLAPLIGDLFGLFGGGSSSAQPQLEKYQMPSSIDFEAAEGGSGLAEADYDQMGMPRLYNDPSTVRSSGPVNSPGPGGPTGLSSSPGGSSAAANSAPQISVNVQAMDARSFMDYSGEIANAVRDAMLNLSSINDVVNEL